MEFALYIDKWKYNFALPDRAYHDSRMQDGAPYDGSRNGCESFKERFHTNLVAIFLFKINDDRAIFQTLLILYVPQS